MKPLHMVAVSLAATLTSAVYTGDIVQYWIDQTSQFINGTAIGGLQTPQTAWSLAITSASMYNAAVGSQDESLDFQQIAVSHAAHNALVWIFHGSRLYPYIDQALRTIQTQILAAADPFNLTEAISAGRHAACEVVASRTDDGNNDFVDYTFGPTVPGVYQLTVDGYGLPPDGPQVPSMSMFATGKPAMTYLAPPPPSVNSESYESFLAEVKAIGGSDSPRTQEQTDIALFWRESAPMFYYNAWRPETAIHHPDIWLASGQNVSDPNWHPLLTPTPIEQEYSSGHACVGGAAAAVLKAFNGGDDIDVTISSLVGQPPGGVITRHFTNLSAASQEISDSRIFGGVTTTPRKFLNWVCLQLTFPLQIHFTFATDVGREIGDQVGRDTVDNFDELWNKF